MSAYVDWVIANPLLSAAIHFAILGTLGELLAAALKAGRPKLPCSPPQLAAKVLAWALLGVVIKYGFTGMKGFTAALVEHQLLPGWCGAGFGWALSVSILTNILFGPQMMAFHRIEDNLILRQRGYAGLTTAWWTLIWFWIPAHTITFSLPTAYQVGLAAVWSVALGVIMGYVRR